MLTFFKKPFAAFLLGLSLVGSFPSGSGYAGPALTSTAEPCGEVFRKLSVFDDPTAARVDLREGVKKKIQAQAPKDPNGNYIDPNTGSVILKTGPFDYGHRRGYEWWRTVLRAKKEAWTREMLIEYENDPGHYQIESVHSNRAHTFELPHDQIESSL